MRLIGVIGGMGPFATADFFAKLLQETGATREEDNIPVLIQSDPRIPSRPRAILEQGASPLPALLAARERLVAAGATALAMPCNTAHYWYRALTQDCVVPFISIVEASCDAAAAQVRPGGLVGLLATRATIAADLFGRPLAARGLELVASAPSELEAWLLPCIEHVKAGRTNAAAPLLQQAIASMVRRRAQAVLLACTELPIALDATGAAENTLPCIDTTRELARACVAHWRGGLRSKGASVA
jgi:aspartate racemase